MIILSNMSKFKEDEIYEIFTDLRKSSKLSKLWDNEMKILKSKDNYHCDPCDLYITAYNNIKK